MSSVLRLRTTLAVIFGGFTLGFYVAIQGPTLMDLIDLLHVNNDIMSYSLAFASLAYSVGGLLSGFLFNYVNRQILISIYFIIFGVSNIATPYISNYLIFSVITVFKMMCAGGTDCGANVWILEMWPGKDAWLQALHFSFAVGCALGPLLVEPFLSEDPLRGEGGALAAEGLDKIRDKTSGSTTINDQANESRIHIPYAVSGLASIFASMYILYLYFVDKRLKEEAAKLRLKQQAAAGEHILLTALQHPAALEAGASLGAPADGEDEDEEDDDDDDGQPQQQVLSGAASKDQQQQQVVGPSESAKFLTASPNETAHQPGTVVLQLGPLKQQQQQPEQQQQQVALIGEKQQPGAVEKISSRAREQPPGRPPYYVIFATALAALSLSFYCGIEITSMNYLATFAVHIDLQLPKSTAALMSSALTISFAMGRGLGILIANYMKPHKLFYLCAAIMSLGNIFMFIFANTAEKLLWCSICVFGIGCGPMFPAIVSFFDDRISKVTNTVSGIFILGSMFNVALNSLIIGHHIIDNALILIVCNLVGSVILLLLFGTLHMLTKVKKNQRVKKYRLKQAAASANSTALPPATGQQHKLQPVPEEGEQQISLLQAPPPPPSQQQQPDESGKDATVATTFNTPSTTTTPPNASNNNNNDNDKNQRQSSLSQEQTNNNNKTTTPPTTDRVTVTIQNDHQAK